MARKSQQTIASAVGQRFVIVLEGEGGRGFYTNTGNFQRNESLARRFMSEDLAGKVLDSLKISKGFAVGQALKIERERIAD